jgi:hypothetical protein
MKKENRKYTIFDGNGRVTTKIWPVRTICESHRQLARIIEGADMDEGLRADLLDRVDEVYDMGKRMGDKLQGYYEKDGSSGHWDNGFYQEGKL